MVDEVGTITIRANTKDVDRGTASLKRMERQSVKTEKRASDLGRTVARVATIVGVGLFARKAIQNTIRQEKATAQLNAVLKSTGRFSEETSRALRDQAQAFQEVTTFGDEAVIETQALLLTFKELGGDVFPRATEAVLDISTAMNQDLKSTVVQVGKALNDPIKGLQAMSRVGITFSKSQEEVIKKMVEVGDLAGAQAAILDELESQFQGSARAARETLGGSLEALGNAFGDLLEADGDSLPGVTDEINDLTELLNSPEVKEGFQIIVQGMVDLLGIAVQLPGAIGFVTDEIQAMFGIIDDDDIPRLEDQLISLRNTLESGGGGPGQAGLLGRFLFDDEDAAEVEAEIARIEGILDAYYNKPREPVKIGTEITTETAIPGLDTGGGATGGEQTKEELRAAEEAAKRWAKTVEEGRRATEDLLTTVQDTSAELGGPAAQAQLDYNRALEEVVELEEAINAAGLQNVETEKLLDDARANALEQYEREIELIKEKQEELENQLSPAEELIQSLELELELMKLGADEREREIVQRQLLGKATEEQLKQIDDYIAQRQELERSIETLDEIRGTAQDFLIDLTDGSGSVADAFDDMFDRIKKRALELAAEKIIEKIFGAFGTAGGGGFGGGGGGGGFGDIFSSLLGGLFGGGKATGGPVRPGNFYEVGEQGPELLTVGGRNYLIPEAPGTVTPQQSNTYNQNKTDVRIIVPPPQRDRTLDQLSTRMGREIRRAEARNL